MKASVTAPVLALTILLGACGGSASKDAASAAGSPDTVPGGTVVAGSTATPTPGVPTSMEQAEGLAEDVQDDIASGRWAAGQAKVSQLQGLSHQLASDGASQENVASFSSALDTLAAAIRAKRRFQALTAANRDSRVLNAMMANYPTRVPIAVAYMDVAGRDVLYDAQRRRLPMTVGRP